MHGKDDESLIYLDTIAKRVAYLLEINGYLSAYEYLKKNEVTPIGKTTLYKILNEKGNNISDRTIQALARSFNVSESFIKFGGETLGIYEKSKMPDESYYVVDVEGLVKITIEQKKEITKAYNRLLLICAELSKNINHIMEVLGTD